MSANRPIQEYQIVKRHHNITNDYTIVPSCVMCDATTTLTITGQQMYQLQTSAKLLQDILPDQPAAIRELFISGYCGKCWDELFKDEEES